jgi:hypothetical protein
MRRASCVTLVLIALALLPAGPASAGGSLMEGNRGYGVGERATFRGSFSMSGSLEGRLSDGPYFAYLAPLEIYDVDHPHAVRLGEIRMVPSDVWGMIATVEFTVPAVPTGHYHLTYCNEPCTVDGIGDLMGGDAFFVAPTRQEALLLSRVDRLSWRLTHARQEGRAKERRALEKLARAQEAGARERTLARGEIATLEARIAELRAAPARDEQPLVSGWAIAVVALILAVAVAVVATAIVRRRDAHRFKVPDTIPDEIGLEELDLRR